MSKEFKFKLNNNRPVIVFLNQNDTIISKRITTGEVRENENLKFCILFDEGSACLGAKLNNSNDNLVSSELISLNNEITDRCLINDITSVLTEKEICKLILDEINGLYTGNMFRVYDKNKQEQINDKLVSKARMLQNQIDRGNKNAKNHMAVIDYLYSRDDDIYQVYMNISSLLHKLNILGLYKNECRKVIEDDIDVNSEKAHDIITEIKKEIEFELEHSNNDMSAFDFSAQKRIEPNKRIVMDENKVIRKVEIDTDTEPVLVTDMNQTVLFKLTDRFYQRRELVNVSEDFSVTYIEGLKGYIIPVLKVDTEKYSFKEDSLQVFAFEQEEDDVLIDLGVNINDVKTFDSKEFKKVLSELRLEILKSNYYTQKCINDFLRGFVYKSVMKEDGTIVEIADDSSSLIPNLKKGYRYVLEFLNDSDKDEFSEIMYSASIHLDEYGKDFIIKAFKDCTSKNLCLVITDDSTKETKPCNVF